MWIGKCIKKGLQYGQLKANIYFCYLHICLQLYTYKANFRNIFFSGGSIHALYASGHPFLLNEICSNQTYLAHNLHSLWKMIYSIHCYFITISKRFMKNNKHLFWTFLHRTNRELVWGNVVPYFLVFNKRGWVYKVSIWELEVGNVLSKANMQGFSASPGNWREIAIQSHFFVLILYQWYQQNEAHSLISDEVLSCTILKQK